jgi:hypothetical protein
MGFPMALCYMVVQFIAATAGSVTAAALFGTGGNLAATVPQPVSMTNITTIKVAMPRVGPFNAIQAINLSFILPPAFQV